MTVRGGTWEAVGLRLRESFRLLSEENTRLKALIEAYSHVNSVDVVDGFFRRSKLGGLSQSTLRQYRYVLDAFFRHTSGRVDVSRDDIERYLEAGLSRGWGASTVNNQLAVLRVFYRYVSEERKTPDPTASIPKAKSPKRQRVYLVKDEITPFLARCASRRDYVVVRSLLATGLRVGELVALDVCDIDSANCRVVVRHGKGDKYREVDVDDVTMDELVSWCGVRSGPIFVNRHNRRLSVRAVQRILKAVCDGFPKKITPHKLRHTLAMALLNSGASLETVRAELGHASFSTTQIYADVEDARRTNEYVSASPFREVVE